MLEHEDYEQWKARNVKRKAPERNVKDAVCDWLDLHKAPWNRMNSGKVQVINPGTRKAYWLQLCKKGTEDISAIWKGRYLAIETKSAVGVMSKEQRHRKIEVEAAGGIYILARSVDDLAPLLSL